MTVETKLFYCGKEKSYEVPVKTWEDIKQDINDGDNNLILKMENGFIFIDLSGSGNNNLVAIKY